MFQKIKKIKQVVEISNKDLKYGLSFLKNYDLDQEVIFSKLRTNAHVLDKGVNIIPFETGHGLAIYKQCLSLKKKITDEEILTDKSYQWVCSIIEKYEKKQKNDVPQAENKVLKFQCVEDEKQAFYKIVKNRVSCRNYVDKAIPDNVWNEIIAIAADAPSGCCRQPSKYYIESNPNKIHDLRMNIAGATGFSSKIPYLICVTSDVRSYSVIDRLLPIIDTSLSIQNFLLACTANNVFTTPLNWQHATKKEEKAVREILNIPDYEKIILFITAGYPNIIPEKPERLGLKWIRKR
jgi:nitroreductase